MFCKKIWVIIFIEKVIKSFPKNKLLLEENNMNNTMYKAPSLQFRSEKD